MTQTNEEGGGDATTYVPDKNFEEDRIRSAYRFALIM